VIANTAMQPTTIADLAVALVEPSPTQQRIIMTHLYGMGVRRVASYHDAASALAGIRGDPPDLMISAMHLPDRTGTELAQALRADPATADVLFMLISSETSYRHLEPLKQAGVVAILPKPFAPGDLRNALLATLDYIVPDNLALADVDLDRVRVLIVDDSNTSRNQIRRVLQNMGIEHIDDVADGKDALTAIDNTFYDLIVTDYNMPELDGQGLTYYIRKRSAQRSVPILMVTSMSDQTRLAQVKKSGVSAICDKPFAPTEMKELIRRMLAGD
jgi:two-component system chemotaxis response regulator CheY